MYRNATAALAAAAVGLTLAGLSAAGGQQAPASVPRAARAGTANPVAPSVPAMSSAAQTELVATYCSTCHSERAKAGGLSLAGFNAMRAAESPEVVEKMLRKLRAGMMPPAGAKRPPAGSLDELTVALEARMDEHAAVNPNPGWRPFQRLNRAEYQRAVHELLGVDVDVTPLLPPDTISHGFDNVADAQTFSPTLMEGYLRAASRVTALAVGDPDSAPGESTYSLPKTASQLARADGRSARHPRRHLDDAHVPGRRRLRVPPRFLRRAARHPVRQHRYRRADRGVDQRRARGALRHRPAHERDHVEPVAQDALGARAGRAAAGHGGVPAALRGASQRPGGAHRAHAGRHRNWHRRRHHHPAAPAQSRRRGPAQGHRHVRYGQPAQDLHLPAHVGRRRDGLCHRRSCRAWRPGRSVGRRPSARSRA